MKISDDEWFRIFQRLDKLDLQKSKSSKRRSDRGHKRSRKYKSRARVACSTKRKKSCINNLACHWETGKGCKSGGSKESQAHLLLKKSRRVRRSRRSRKRRSYRGHKRSRKYKSRARVACSTKRKKSCINNLACHWETGKGCKSGGSKESQAHLLVKKSRRVRRSRRSRKRRSDRGHKRSRKYKKRRSRKGRPRKGVACSRKRKQPCIDNLACHWIPRKGCKKT